MNNHKAKRVSSRSPAMEEDDGRREAAIASAPSLQANFIPRKGLNPSQISKFQELHRRRLKIKAKSKVKDKPKRTPGNVEKYGGKDINAKLEEVMDTKTIKTVEDPGIASSISSATDISSAQEDKMARHTMSKKPQKLHWGLDTKERWERKSNM